MYLGTIIVLMLVLPLLSVAAQASMLPDAAALMGLVGKWFTFWGVGVRLPRRSDAGVPPPIHRRGYFRDRRSSRQAIVREVGFGNLAMGTLGILSLFVPDFLLPAAIAGSLYYGLAGIGHTLRKERNAKEQVALVSDLLIFVLLAGFVTTRVM